MQSIELTAAGVHQHTRAALVINSSSVIDCSENAPRDLQRITASDANARRIGHCGFFRAQFEATLWARVTGLFQRFSTGVPA